MEALLRVAGEHSRVHYICDVSRSKRMQTPEDCIASDGLMSLMYSALLSALSPLSTITNQIPKRLANRIEVQIH
jgi:hypothetical protein